MHKLTRSILATWIIILIGSISCYAATTKKLTQYANLAAAISAVGSDDVNLVIDKNDTLAADLTIPSNVHCLWIHDAIVTTDGNTLTFNYAPDIGLFQAFDAAAGEVVFAAGTLETAYAEWWGAVAAAAVGDVVNCNAAIVSAVATGKNVQLLDGYYGVTGLIRLAADGQKLRGTGRRMADANGGTFLQKLSGTDYVIQMGAFGGLEVSHLTIDGGGLAGNLLSVSGAYYGKAEALFFQDVGGTSYALNTTNANVNTFSNISIGADCYGGIEVVRTAAGGSAGYSDFNQIIMGPTTAYAIRVSEYNVSLNFNQVYCESPIIIEGASEGINFNGLSFESQWDSSPLITINSSNTRLIQFKNVRVNQSAATTYPVFSLTDGRTIEINGLYVTDLASAAAKDVIAADGLYGFAVKNAQIYSLNSFDFIECSGDQSYFVDMVNCNYVSGAKSLCKWKTISLTVNGSNMDQSFLAGTDARTILQNIFGAVDTANAGSSLVLLNTPEPTDAGNLVTFGLYGNKRVVIPYYSQDAEPAIPQDSIARWTDTDAGPKYYLIGNFAGTQAKIELTP